MNNQIVELQEKIKGINLSKRSKEKKKPEKPVDKSLDKSVDKSVERQKPERSSVSKRIKSQENKPTKLNMSIIQNQTILTQQLRHHEAHNLSIHYSLYVRAPRNYCSSFLEIQKK